MMYIVYFARVFWPKISRCFGLDQQFRPLVSHYLCHFVAHHPMGIIMFAAQCVLHWVVVY